MGQRTLLQKIILFIVKMGGTIPLQTFRNSIKTPLLGDSLYYERNNGIGKALGHIWLMDSTQKIITTGNYAYYREKPQYALVTDSAVLMQYSDTDTLHIHADTLISVVTDTVKNDRKIRAFRHVKIFKPDLQGKCDSLTYLTSDSTMRLYNKPVLWSGENQLSSEYIELHMANKKLNSMILFNNAFAASKEDTGKYNQIKGKKMTGFFKDNKLFKVNVSGNGQTLFHAKENEIIIGINKAVCSDIIIYINNNKIQKTIFLTQPDATFFPLSKTPPEDRSLRDFKWYEKSRPLTKNDIFKWVEE
jgi:lipopolysaccharide export system protein LptA